MLYELRCYDIDPDLMDEYLVWANDRAVPLLAGEFGFQVVGFWQVVAPADGTATSPTNIHWIIAWQNEPEMLARWGEALASPQWAAIREGQPRFHLKVERKLLQPIPRSPLQ
jgi:hypothetical protein